MGGGDYGLVIGEQENYNTDYRPNFSVEVTTLYRTLSRLQLFKRGPIRSSDGVRIAKIRS
ncbi:hypothetical protein LINPERPRIM_LOCUS11078 [Linum perenne]